MTFGSQGAGVLLANYGYDSGATSSKDFTEQLPPVEGGLKSVYEMRVSHSNLATRPMS